MLRLRAAQAALPLAIIAIWHLAATLGMTNAFATGSPEGIAEATLRMIQDGSLLRNTATTVGEVVTGFALGNVIGASTGLLLWFSRLAARAVEPFIVAVNGVPKIALAPLVIIWFGTGPSGKVFLAFMATGIVALISAYEGTRSVDPAQVALCRTFRATRWQIFSKIVVPSSLPWVISSFRVNIGLALTAAVAGEFISSNSGLGNAIYLASNVFDISGLWASIIALMVVALCMYGGVGWLESRLLPWRRETRRIETHGT